MTISKKNKPPKVTDAQMRLLNALKAGHQVTLPRHYEGGASWEENEACGKIAGKRQRIPNKSARKLLEMGLITFQHLYGLMDFTWQSSWGQGGIVVLTYEGSEMVGGHPDFVRASGQCICEKCGRDYYSHREVRFGDLVLVRVCSGNFVKL